MAGKRTKASSRVSSAPGNQTAIPPEPISLEVIRQNRAQRRAHLRKDRSCKACVFFRDMCQPALTALAPSAPAIPISDAADLIQIAPQHGFLDLCPLCAQLLQAFLQAKAQQARDQMEPEELARRQARERILTPGTPGFVMPR